MEQNAGNQHFLHFSTMFSPLSNIYIKKKKSILATSNWGRGYNPHTLEMRTGALTIDHSWY